jgi:hypothetical protein
MITRRRLPNRRYRRVQQRRSMMTEEWKEAVGWYTPESWERLRAVADDVVMTFAEFEQKATRKVRELEAEGFTVEKVMVGR